MEEVNNMRSQLRNFALAGVLLASPVLMQAATTNTMQAAPANRVQRQTLSSLENSVRHELVMLPYYNVFDNLAFKVDGDTVTLTGQVTRPTLKSDAENVVKRLEGVHRVNNQIEVLPLSPMDDRIRWAVARSIYGYGPLQRYALGSQPPIHIIVKNGNVSLEGVVGSDFDKNVANIRANGVPGVFSVTNDLRVDSRG
jgi:hyperosmotically inducible protein